MKYGTVGICIVLGVLWFSEIASAEKKPPPKKPAPKKQAESIKSVGSYSDQQIETAIQGCIKYLWSIQLKKGGAFKESYPDGRDADGKPKFGKRTVKVGADWSDSWGPAGHVGSGHYWPAGPTALACYALLAAGESPKKAQMKKALDWLVKTQLKDKMNYTVGIRCNTWLKANQDNKDIYRKMLQKDVERLYMTSVLRGGGGCYYTLDPGETLANQKLKGPENHCKVSLAPGGDHSNGQYTVLGVWAGAQNRLEIRKEFWAVNMKYWMKSQNPDGGWAYHWKSNEKLCKSCGSMSTAGLATLFVCFDEIFADRFIKCDIPKGPEWQALQKGLDWFDKNFETTITKPWCSRDKGNLFYYLYGVERVGLASGYRYFGKVDWLKEGNKRILAAQNSSGAVGKGVVNTAYALLFLIRGRQPILMNKLEAPSFDWNNRPRDCANLTKWMSHKFEAEFRWQIVTLQSPVSDWVQSPLLYLSGSKTPTFTEPELEKIRRYVLQGGTLFSATECNKRAFGTGIRKVYQQLFPKLEMVPLGKDHELTQIHFPLKGRPKLFMIHNGIRPIVIHCDQDLPKEWQLNKYAVSKWAFQAVANLYLHQTDKETKFQGTRSWPEVADQTSRTVKIARIRHAGRCDPEPLAYERLVRLMGKKHAVKVELAEPETRDEKTPEDAPEAKVESEVWDALIPATELKDHPDVKFAHITGTGALPLTDEEKAALKTFVDSGGTLLIDAAGSSRTFAEAARKFIAATWEGELTTLDAGHALYNLPDMKIEKATFRRKTKKNFGAKSVPQLQAILIDKRPAVIFSDLDITAGLVGFDNYSALGYAPDTAFELLRNMVLFSATSAPPAPEEPPVQ